MISRTRGIVATAVGNLLEWYDFTVYALFASYIAANFFPADEAPGARLLQTFLVFGLGFIARPAGALLIGQYGDRAGRKAALTLTIGLMAAGTAVIAFSPTYAAIGVGAPCLLLLGRLLQGFSAGGEVGGATAFLLESAAGNRRGRTASWLQASMGMANIVGALTAYLVATAFTADQVRSWAWRIPFMIGLAIAPVGWFLRRALAETGAFEALAQSRRRAAAQRAPLIELLRGHGRRVLIGIAVAMLWAVAVYVLMVFMPTYIQRPDTFDFSASQAFGASLLGNVPFVIGCVAAGSLSDRLGRRTSLAVGAAALLFGIWPLFIWLKTDPNTSTLLVVQCLVCSLVACFVGVAPAALSEIFPPSVRSTGTSLVYNSAFTIFGGFAPSVLTWLGDRSGASVFAPAWYVMLAAAIALAAIPFLKRSDS